MNCAGTTVIEAGTQSSTKEHFHKHGVHTLQAFGSSAILSPFSKRKQRKRHATAALKTAYSSLSHAPPTPPPPPRKKKKHLTDDNSYQLSTLTRTLSLSLSHTHTHTHTHTSIIITHHAHLTQRTKILKLNVPSRKPPFWRQTNDDDTTIRAPLSGTFRYDVVSGRRKDVVNQCLQFGDDTD